MAPGSREELGRLWQVQGCCGVVGGGDDVSERNGDVDGLDRLLDRSEALELAIIDLLDADGYEVYDDSARIAASHAACSVSLEHSQGLRLLIGEGLPTSGVSLMRLQHEALTRAVWLFYAASDEEVKTFVTPLTPATEKVASKLPMLTAMLAAIVGKAPLPAMQMLRQFKDVHTSALNSFVHGGIHPVQRLVEGYPVPLLMQVVLNSNGLLTGTGMLLAILSGRADVAKQMAAIQPAFADCLPELLAAPAG